MAFHKDYSAQGFDKNGDEHVPSFGNNPLKESFAVNRLEKSALKNDVNSRQLDNLRRNDRNPLEDRSMNAVARPAGRREEEEALFSKMREMKESLINQDVMKRSINGRSSTSSFKYNQLGESKPDNTRQFDPRVENIDKINSKIKQILNCLAENEKPSSKYLKISPKKTYDRE